MTPTKESTLLLTEETLLQSLPLTSSILGSIAFILSTLACSLGRVRSILLDVSSILKCADLILAVLVSILSVVF